MNFSAPVVEEIDSILGPALAGEIEAQQELLRRFSVYIRACARKFFLTAEDRQDLLQEGRIALFHAIQRYSSVRGPFSPYARLVIRRRMYRAADKMIRRNSVERIHEYPEEIGDTAGLLESRNPESLMMEDERMKEFSRRIQGNLTHLEHDVLSMFLQGMSYREMARRLKRPTKSVDNALRRIRSKVKA